MSCNSIIIIIIYISHLFLVRINRVLIHSFIRSGLEILSNSLVLIIVVVVSWESLPQRLSINRLAYKGFLKIKRFSAQ